jgi:hypothetical protein
LNDTGAASTDPRRQTEITTITQNKTASKPKTGQWADRA